MTPEQRRKASADLTLTYLQSYYPSWRLAKILSIKKQLDTKYDFFKDFIDDIKDGNDKSGEATIAMEIRNGLHFDAISHCVQSVEDLFALISASQKPDYFVRNIITYRPGKVTKPIKDFKANRKQVIDMYHIPDGLPFSTETEEEKYQDAIAYLSNLTTDVVKFYKDYEYFHNQYKHGLTVAMKPFGNTYTDEQIEQEKKGEFPFYLATYNNQNPQKKGKYDFGKGLFMAGFTENVRPFISQLMKEDNFIQLVFPENIDLDIDFLVDMAKKVRECLFTFIYNYSRKIKPEGDIIDFRLPIDYTEKRFIKFTYDPNEGK